MTHADAASMVGAHATVWRSVAERVASQALAEGVRREDVRKVSGLATGERAGDRVAFGRLLDLWGYLGRTVGDTSLPLRVAEGASLDDLGVLGFALLSAPTLRDAGATMARFGALLTDSGRWEVRERGPRAEMVWHRPAGLALGERLSNETALAQCLRGLERLAGQRIPVLEVAFRHSAPQVTRDHAMFFGGRVRFDADEDRLVFDRALLDAAPAGAHRGLWGYLCQQAAGSCEDAPPPTLAGAVAAKLDRALRAGHGQVPSIAAVACALGSSERTLRRRLVDEGTNWRVLLDDARRARAAERMTRPGATVTEVALELGFADGTAFAHACKRWFGCAPSALRERAGAAPATGQQMRRPLRPAW